MNQPEVEVNINATKLSPWQGNTTNSIIILVYTKSVEILENPITGHRALTGRSTPVSRPFLININLRSTSHSHILQLLRNQLVNHHWLCFDLASDISMVATHLGFGHNGFIMNIRVKITYQTIVVLSDPSPSNDEALSLETISRMILLGKIGREELKRLNLETESCSICLDNLYGNSKYGAPTRMTCSHVFHGRCLLEWLRRKNTCPMCRTVLYGQ